MFGIGLLRVGLSQSCDNVVTAGIESVSSAPQSSHEQYGLFLNLQSPVTCTGKVTKFEYAYYKGSGGGQTFTIQLSLWRPGANGMYTKVCQWAFHCCYVLSEGHTHVIRHLSFCNMHIIDITLSRFQSKCAMTHV